MDGYLAGHLVNATLNGGRLQLIGLTSDEIKQLSIELREDLLRCQIPHRKAIGAYVKAANGCWMSDYVTKVSGVGSSYIEIFVAMNDLIINEYEDSAKQECLTTIENKIESTNGSLIRISTREEVNALIRDIPIVEFEKLGYELNLLTYRAKGIVDFTASSRIIGAAKYKPLRAVYDLNHIFTIKLYEDGDDSVCFMYKKAVDEFVLLNILQCYAFEICKGDINYGCTN